MGVLFSASSRIGFSSLQVEFQDCEFRNNVVNSTGLPLIPDIRGSSTSGGAVYFQDSNVTLNNVKFENNSAVELLGSSNNANSASGGALYGTNSRVTAYACTFFGNSVQFLIPSSNTISSVANGGAVFLTLPLIDGSSAVVDSVASLSGFVFLFV